MCAMIYHNGVGQVMGLKFKFVGSLTSLCVCR
jgi:hypothetical protein